MIEINVTPTTKPERRRVSYSTLSLFDACPRLFEAYKLRRVEEIRPAPLVIGGLAHEIIAEYLGHLTRERKTSDPEVVPAIVAAAFADADGTAYFDDVLAIATGFARRHVHDADATMEIEGSFARDLGETHRVVGFVDYAYVARETLVVRDFKTSWGSHVDESMELQQGMYAWLAQERYGDMPIATEIEFVRSGVISDRREWSTRDLARVQTRMQSIATRLRAAFDRHDWPAKPGAWCSYCPVSLSCAKRFALTSNDLALATPTSAQIALEEAVILEAALDARRSALREYVDAHGPIETNDVAARFQTRERTALRDVVGLINALGSNAIDYLSIDNRTTRALKEDARVAHLWRDERETRFVVAAKKRNE